MALYLYDRVMKCHDTQSDVSSIPSMSWYLDNNMPWKVFNVHVNVSIGTKLYTCKIRMYNINISLERAILRALDVHP